MADAVTIPVPSGRPNTAYREAYDGGRDGNGPATPSSDYKAMEPYWRISRDLVEGLPALQDGGEKYLPKFLEESPAMHSRRVKNARLTNAFRKALIDLSARPFTKPATLADNIPEPLAAVLENPEMRGRNLADLAHYLFFHCLADGLTWLLVDRPATVPMGVRSVAEARGGGRVYWRAYDPLDVIAAYSETDSEGREYLSEVRILERETERQEWKEKVAEFVRVFRRLPDGVVTWMRYRKVEQKQNSRRDEWVEDTRETRLDISRIPMIPVVFGLREGMSWRVDPPLKDAAYLQIELFQQENGLKNVSELAAFPMLAANGIEPELGKDRQPKKLPVGPMAVLYGRSGLGGAPPGSWAILESNGQSLRFLLDQYQDTRKEMAELTQKPLREAPNLTVVAAASGAEESNNAVQAWTSRLERSIDDALNLTAEWMGMRDFTAKETVEFHKDFEIGLGHMDVSTLLASAVADPPLISRDTFLVELQRRGILSASFDADADLEAIAKAAIGDEGDDDGDGNGENNLPGGISDPAE